MIDRLYYHNVTSLSRLPGGWLIHIIHQKHRNLIFDYEAARIVSWQLRSNVTLD